MQSHELHAPWTEGEGLPAWCILRNQKLYNVCLGDGNKPSTSITSCDTHRKFINLSLSFEGVCLTTVILAPGACGGGVWPALFDSISGGSEGSTGSGGKGQIQSASDYSICITESINCIFICCTSPVESIQKHVQPSLPLCIRDAIKVNVLWHSVWEKIREAHRLSIIAKPAPPVAVSSAQDFNYQFRAHMQHWHMHIIHSDRIA